MNERIWEIWRTDVHRFARRQQLVDQDVIEKFAELIIRECANVAADHDALDIYEEIREHFGVEE